jgi:phosphate/phosphite/phosphonate ABC transporter binding protein
VFTLLWGAVLGTACTSPAEPATVAAAEVAPAAALARPAKLVLGVNPFLGVPQMREEFGPLVEYLGREVGVPVQLHVPATYADLVDDLGADRVHLAVLSPLNYVRAKRQHPDLRLLVTQIADGSSFYLSYIVTAAQSDIQSLEDLRGKRFGFVNRRSTSGYLYPRAHLRERGIDPKTYFSETLLAGDHSVLVQWVLDGKVDAGATFTSAYKLAQPGSLRILAKTGRIPYDAYCASVQLPQEMVHLVKGALLRLNSRTDEGRRVLGRQTMMNGFVEVKDSHYDEVRGVERWLAEQDGDDLP